MLLLGPGFPGNPIRNFLPITAWFLLGFELLRIKFQVLAVDIAMDCLDSLVTGSHRLYDRIRTGNHIASGKNVGNTGLHCLGVYVQGVS